MGIIKGIVKEIAKEVFPDVGVSPYTSRELKRAVKALHARGYFYKPERAHQGDDNLKEVVHDYLKTDAGGNVIGMVTMHIAKNKADHALVEDGIVTIAYDEELEAKVGRTTTVSEFAQKMDPGPIQKVVTSVFPDLKDG